MYSSSPSPLPLPPLLSFIDRGKKGAELEYLLGCGIQSRESEKARMNEVWTMGQMDDIVAERKERKRRKRRKRRKEQEWKSQTLLFFFFFSFSFLLSFYSFPSSSSPFRFIFFLCSFLFFFSSPLLSSLLHPSITFSFFFIPFLSFFLHRCQILNTCGKLICILCNQTISATKKSLQKHQLTKRHSQLHNDVITGKKNIDL